jgi:excisionase family DNA binding protein
MIEFPDKKLFRPSEIAEIVGVSKPTIYMWIAIGKLDAVRIGKTTLRIRRQDAIKLVTQAID